MLEAPVEEIHCFNVYVQCKIHCFNVVLYNLFYIDSIKYDFLELFFD